ncbi:RDD family protein [Neolewinella antarctica]|uniref:RDD family membrane protein YckC n=1 Tax=Neolewinella antarctica TaxID=442734 RepID=A0ABX0XCP5_9BACT|nr:RDD family protein [Neolewinella antarctica]NJC26840.1 putative RDD family membrane protein YckC [Neolewinella antarctica]
MQPNPTTYAPASFFRRALAYFIDSILIGLATAPAYYFLIYEGSLYAGIAIIVVGGAYKPLMEARYGWTLGKLSQRIQIVDVVTGVKPDLNQSLLRYLPWAIGVLTGILVTIRVFEQPDFDEVKDIFQYVEAMQKSSLSENFFVRNVSSLPIFSSVWMISDPLRQTLHDKLAKTLVVAMPEESVTP